MLYNHVHLAHESVPPSDCGVSTTLTASDALPGDTSAGLLNETFLSLANSPAHSESTVIGACPGPSFVLYVAPGAAMFDAWHAKQPLRASSVDLLFPSLLGPVQGYARGHKIELALKVVIWDPLRKVTVPWFIEAKLSLLATDL